MRQGKVAGFFENVLRYGEEQFIDGKQGGSLPPLDGGAELPQLF